MNQVVVTKKISEEGDVLKGGEDVNTPTTAVTSTEVECTNCGKPVQVNRFAPHLEKCAAVHKMHGTVASRKNKRRAAITGTFFAEGSSDDLPDVEEGGKVANTQIEDEEYKYEEQLDEFDSPHPPRSRNKRASADNSPKSNTTMSVVYFIEKGKKSGSAAHKTIPVDEG